MKAWRWGDPRLGYALERDARTARSNSCAKSTSTRGVIVATVPPELPPAVAGINVQLALELPAGRLGTAASSPSVTACGCDWSRRERTARVSKLVWSKPDG